MYPRIASKILVDTDLILYPSEPSELEIPGLSHNPKIPFSQEQNNEP